MYAGQSCDSRDDVQGHFYAYDHYEDPWGTTRYVHGTSGTGLSVQRVIRAVMAIGLFLTLNLVRPIQYICIYICIYVVVYVC